MEALRVLPANVRVQPPTVDVENVLQLLQKITAASYNEQLQAAHKLAELLEAEESRYQDLVGDVYWNPSQRSNYAIGKILAIVQDWDEYDRVVDGWVLSRSATEEQQVAGMRLVLALLTCWQFQYPLTEQSLVEQLHRTAIELGDQTPLRTDLPLANEEALLKEARQVYATGLLAIAIQAEEVSDSLVRTPLATFLSTYLRRMSQQPLLSPAEQAKRCAEGGLAARSFALRVQRERCAVQCLHGLGEYVECLGPVLAESGPEVAIELLQRSAGDRAMVVEVLRLWCALLAHRRFAELLVDAGGVQALLALPRDQHVYTGLSLALFGLASLPLAFERVCALPAPVPARLTEAALGLLGGGFDPARRNAAQFFGAAINFRAVLDDFDEQGGLRVLLNVLQTTLRLLRSNNMADLKQEKIVGYHAAFALRQYMRTHMVLLLTSLLAKVGAPGYSRAVRAAEAARYKAVDISADVLDGLVATLESDARLGEAAARAKAPALEALLDQGAPALLLELVEAAPADRYFTEMGMYALEVLHLMTLLPFTRRPVYSARLPSQHSGFSVLLHAASTPHMLGDVEAVQASALQVIANCVAVPPSLAHLLPAAGSSGTVLAGHRGATVGGPTTPGAQAATSAAQAPPPLELGPAALSPAAGQLTLAKHLEAGYSAARAALRSANGIRVLLSLLQPRAGTWLPAGSLDRIRGLACRTLLGLAADPSIRHILTKLQVGKMLAEMVREPRLGGAMATTTGQASAALGCTTGWPEAFNQAALELVALTAPVTAGRAGQVTAAAQDVGAPALHKIERAAIAAATQITFNPQELLLLMFEHLRAAGMLTAAAALAKEAGLNKLPQASAPQQQQPAAATAGPSGTATKAGGHQGNSGAASGAGGTALKKRAMSVSAALLQAVSSNVNGPLLPPASGPLTPASTAPTTPGLAAAAPASGMHTPNLTSVPGALGGQPPSTHHAAESRPMSPPAHSSARGPKRKASSQQPSPAAPPQKLPRSSRKDSAGKQPPEPMATDLPLLAPHPQPHTQQEPGPSSTANGTSAAMSDAQYLTRVSSQPLPSSSTLTSPSMGPPQAAAALPAPAFTTPGQSSMPTPGAAPGSPARHTLSPFASAQRRDFEAPPLPPGTNPLLTGLPRRGHTAAASSRGAPHPARALAIADHAPCPKELPLHVQAAAKDAVMGPPPSSKLSSIVLSFLRHQHRQACMAAPSPIATLPPLSLLKPHVLPQASRPLDAPVNVASRTIRREAFGGHAGRGGARLDRQMIYSRFRLLRSFRDDFSSMLTCCAFLNGSTIMAVGNTAGELKLHHAWSGDIVEVSDAHTSGVAMLVVHDRPGEQSLLLSSGRSEVRLWRNSALEGGALHSWEDVCRGQFSSNGTKVVAVSSLHTPRQAIIYDVNNGSRLRVLEDAAALEATAGGAEGRGRGLHSAVFGPTDELLLWGATLWDPRTSQPIHTFDQFTEFSSGCFNPTGLEVILNSEVWDLRTFKLMRSVPGLDSTTITFSPSGDIIYATLRRAPEDVKAALAQRRMRHPLYSAFRTFDASSYSEIATIGVERCVLDLALDPSNCFVAAVTLDPTEAPMTSSVRVYEVGRKRPAEDDEADDEEEGTTTDEEEEEGGSEDDFGAAGGALLRGLAEDAAAAQAAAGSDAEDEEEGPSGSSSQEDDDGDDDDEDDDDDDGQVGLGLVMDAYQNALHEQGLDDVDLQDLDDDDDEEFDDDDDDDDDEDDDDMDEDDDDDGEDDEDDEGGNINDLIRSMT